MNRFSASDSVFSIASTPSASSAIAISKVNRDERYAARFAAKEAAMKALGTGWNHGVRWCDCEVVRLPGGRPTIAFHGKAEEFAAKLGVKNAALSISHTVEQAIAQVILES